MVKGLSHACGYVFCSLTSHWPPELCWAPRDPKEPSRPRADPPHHHCPQDEATSTSHKPISKIPMRCSPVLPCTPCAPSTWGLPQFIHTVLTFYFLDPGPLPTTPSWGNLHSPGDSLSPGRFEDCPHTCLHTKHACHHAEGTWVRSHLLDH